MDLHHEFDVGASIDDIWEAFLDMPRVASCLPGAEVTEAIDGQNVRGTARVKVGPVSLKFAGRGEMTDIDHEARSARVVAQGREVKGRGHADADIRFQLIDDQSEWTTVEVVTRLNLSGAVAQYGRAGGLINEVANQLIGQFVENLETEMARAAPGDSAESPAAVGKGHGCT